MTATPLLDRINRQRPQPEPTPIVERMSPFMRRLAEKRLSEDRFRAVTSLDRWGGDAA